MLGLEPNRELASRALIEQITRGLCAQTLNLWPKAGNKQLCVAGEERDAVASRDDLAAWVHEALRDHGGEASVLDVAKHIWAEHENDLKASGSLFYTWQYDMRWAAKRLRDEGKLAAVDAAPRRRWALRE